MSTETLAWWLVLVLTILLIISFRETQYFRKEKEKQRKINIKLEKTIDAVVEMDSKSDTSTDDLTLLLKTLTKKEK